MLYGLTYSLHTTVMLSCAVHTLVAVLSTDYGRRIPVQTSSTMQISALRTPTLLWREIRCWGNFWDFTRFDPLPLHACTSMYNFHCVLKTPTLSFWPNVPQVEVSTVGLTAKNSTSLQRAPGPPGASVKGEATHCPFWPGMWTHYTTSAVYGQYNTHILWLISRWAGWTRDGKECHTTFWAEPQSWNRWVIISGPLRL